MIFETEISSIGLLWRSNQFCTSYRIRILWYVHQGAGGYSLLVIHVILSKMHPTLIVSVNLNWILYDVKGIDQPSQLQSFLRCLNCSYVLRFCYWKLHATLQLCLL